MDDRQIPQEELVVPAITHTYMEKPGDGTRPLSHLSIYRHPDGFAVEEVVGTIDGIGHRRGEIKTLASGLSQAEAEHRYQREVEARRQTGFRPA